MDNTVRNSIEFLSGKVNNHIEHVLKKCLTHIGEELNEETFRGITKVYPDIENSNYCEYYIDYYSENKILLACIEHVFDNESMPCSNMYTMYINLKIAAIYDDNK
jgi:hypothetical protein